MACDVRRRSRHSLADQARDTTLAELSANDWTTEDGWVENTINGAFMFQHWAHWTTPDEPKNRARRRSQNGPGTARRRHPRLFAMDGTGPEPRRARPCLSCPYLARPSAVVSHRGSSRDSSHPVPAGPPGHLQERRRRGREGTHGQAPARPHPPSRRGGRRPRRGVNSVFADAGPSPHPPHTTACARSKFRPSSSSANRSAPIGWDTAHWSSLTL